MPQQDDLVDELLVEGLRRRDERALAALYDRHARASYSLALRVLGDHQRAEDVVQDAFLKLWRQADLYRANRGRFAAWFLQLVRNRSIDSLRSNSREVVPPAGAWADVFWASVASQDVDPAEVAALAVDGEEVARAIEELAPELRSVIEMAYYGGYSQSEISKELRVPLGTVKTRIRTAMLRLREALVALAPGERADAG